MLFYVLFVFIFVLSSLLAACSGPGGSDAPDAAMDQIYEEEGLNLH